MGRNTNTSKSMQVHKRKGHLKEWLRVRLRFFKIFWLRILKTQNQSGVPGWWPLAISVKTGVMAQTSLRPFTSTISIVMTRSLCLLEMSKLWIFSVRVQSWSAKVESDPVLIRKIFENHQSDPVLIRQYKTMYYILPHKAKQPREAK